MDPFTIVDLIIGLATAAASAFGNAKLTNLATAAKAAADALIAVKNDPATKAEIEGYRIVPKW
jgi:hypothetical protein